MLNGLLNPHKPYPYYMNTGLQAQYQKIDTVVSNLGGLSMSYCATDHVYGASGEGKIFALQGFTLLDDDTAVYAIRDDDDTRCILRTCNLTTKKKLQESNVFNYGHANSMCYDGTYLYIVPIGNIIYRTADPMTQAVPFVSTIAFSSMAYDKVTKKYIARSVEDNLDNSYYELTFNEDGTIGHELIITIPRMTPINQSFEVVNNIIYDVRSEPSLIAMYDLLSGALIGLYNVPSQWHGWVIGEMEDLSYSLRDNKFYLNCTGRYNDSPTEKGNRKIINFFEFGLVPDLSIYQYISGDASTWVSTIDSTRSIYINSNMSEEDMYQIGTEAHPFRHLSDGMGWLQFNDDRTRYDVYVRGEHYGNRVQNQRNLYFHMQEGSYADRIILGFGGNMWIDQNGTIDYIYCYGNNILRTNENLKVNRCELSSNCYAILFHHGPVEAHNSIVRCGSNITNANLQYCVYYSSAEISLDGSDFHNQVAGLNATITPKFLGMISINEIWTTSNLTNPNPDVYELYDVIGRVNGRIIEDINNIPKGTFKGIVLWRKK